MDLGIAGRKALVCAASKGLGRGCALALAQNGVEVTITARTADALEQAAQEIAAATGVRVTPVAGDITTPEGRAAALAVRRQREQRPRRAGHLVADAAAVDDHRGAVALEQHVRREQVAILLRATARGPGPGLAPRVGRHEAVLAAVVIPERPNLTALVAVVFGIGVGQALFNPAYTSLLPQLVGRDDLPGAIALHSAQMNGSRVIGPVIGALLDSAVGAPAVFAVNGVPYLFVVASLVTVHLPEPTPVAAGAARGLRRLGAGFAVARRDPVVRRCLVTIFTFSLISLSFVGQFPVVAERNLGIDERSTAYGALYACFGVGAVLGAMSVGTVFSQRSKERIVRVSLAAYAVALTTFALVRVPGVAFPVVLVVGLTYFCFITSLSTVLQQNLEDHERGAVTPLWIMGFGGTVPIGNLLAGPLIERTSITAVMLVGAVVAVGLSSYARLDRSEAPTVSQPDARAA